MLEKYHSALYKVYSGGTVLVRKLNPISHSINMKVETEISQRCSFDDSFIPAEEGRKVCQRREEATPKESQKDRTDKRNSNNKENNKKRESVRKKRRCKTRGGEGK